MKGLEVHKTTDDGSKLSYTSLTQNPEKDVTRRGANTGKRGERRHDARLKIHKLERRNNVLLQERNGNLFRVTPLRCFYIIPSSLLEAVRFCDFITPCHSRA